MKPHFLLSKKILKDQVKILEDLGLKVSYSYKTNREVGNLLQKLSPSVNFSIHAKDEIEMIKDKSKISFFTQAESINELKQILEIGIKTFVIDNEIDLERILETIKLNCSVLPELPAITTSISILFRVGYKATRLFITYRNVFGMPCSARSLRRETEGG